MKMLDIAGTSLRRFIRDRSNLFFVVVFPMLLVLAIGLVFGGSSVPRLGVVVDESDGLAAEVVASLEANDSIVVERVGERSDLEIDVERQTLSAGLVFPDDYGERILSGDTVTIDYFAQPGTIGSNVAVAVDAAIAEQATRVRAASVVAGDDGELAEALATVDAIEGPGIEVVTVSIETDGPDFTDFGQFGFGAAQELALFVWITSLTSAAYLIENRQLGVIRRMAATPTGTGRILVGELLGRFGIAFIQASLIVVASALLFGVEWGDPVAVALLVIAYCLVGTGAGMLLGSSRWRHGSARDLLGWHEATGPYGDSACLADRRDHGAGDGWRRSERSAHGDRGARHRRRHPHWPGSVGLSPSGDDRLKTRRPKQSRVPSRGSWVVSRES